MSTTNWRRWQRVAAAAGLGLTGALAQAHDTWFEPLATPDEHVLALGTGNQFPLQDSSLGAEYLRNNGCFSSGAVAKLAPQRNTDTALIVRVPADAASCWAQLTPFEIELAADKIAIYLNEVRPPQAMLDEWQRIHARGLPWKERYTKHARIALPGAGAAAALPSGMGMDVLVESLPASVATGTPLVFQVQRDGQPLANFNVELRNDRSRFGIWRRTDADGRLRFAPPLPGLWVLRGVDLRLSESVPDTWDSRFVTLAFEVADQKGSTLKLNARSENQIPAITAIASDPATNTPR